MKVDITWTSSKILAYLILAVGTVYGFVDLLVTRTGSGAVVLTSAITGSGVIIAIKTGSSAYVKSTVNNNLGGNDV